jgi:hypothetical protein
MNLSLTKSEAKTLLYNCDHMIDLERGSIEAYGEQFRVEWENWVNLKVKLRRLLKGKRK